MSYESITSINMNKKQEIKITSYSSNVFPKEPLTWTISASPGYESVKSLFHTILYDGAVLLPSTKTITAFIYRLTEDYYEALTGDRLDDKIMSTTLHFNQAFHSYCMELSYYRISDLKGIDLSELKEAFADYRNYEAILFDELIRFFIAAHDKDAWPDYAKSKHLQLRCHDYYGGDVPIKLIKTSRNVFGKADWRDKSIQQAYLSNKECGFFTRSFLYDTETETPIEKRQLLLDISPFTDPETGDFELAEKMEKRKEAKIRLQNEAYKIRKQMERNRAAS